MPAGPITATLPSTLIFACSGAADVGEIADRAARTLVGCGKGAMFCLAGVGGRIPDMIDRVRAAKTLLVLDGCDKDCARLTLENAGFTTLTHLRVTDCGLAKGQAPPTIQTVVAIANKAVEKLA
jgi:uncharacterized metal-binding protein